MHTHTTADQQQQHTGEKKRTRWLRVNFVVVVVDAVFSIACAKLYTCECVYMCVCGQKGSRVLAELDTNYPQTRHQHRPLRDMTHCRRKIHT